MFENDQPNQKGECMAENIYDKFMKIKIDIDPSKIIGKSKNNFCRCCKKTFPEDGTAGNVAWAHECTERISAHLTWEELGRPSGK